MNEDAKRMAQIESRLLDCELNGTIMRRRLVDQDVEIKKLRAELRYLKRAGTLVEVRGPVYVKPEAMEPSGLERLKELADQLAPTFHVEPRPPIMPTGEPNDGWRG